MKREAVAHSGDDSVAALRRWAIETALPLWASAGLDRERGGFHERLHLDGTPDRSAPRRLRMQARQIYVYAHAGLLGWYPDGRKIALNALDFMVAKYRAPDGQEGYAHLLGPDGAIVDPRRDTYDHMFVLLALSFTARMSGDAQVRALVADLLAFIDAHLTAPDGSFVEGIPVSLPRRQNPHMHAFEAMLALHETLAHPDALARARRMHTLMEQKFFDAQTHTIGEFFTEAWVRAAGEEGEIVEPGHQAEWAWLLRRFERLSGAPRGSRASEVLDAALQWSEPSTGFLIDEGDRSGRSRRTSRRAWPQTELAKAWLGEAEGGRPGAAEKAVATLAAFAAHYLDRTVPGAWMDQFDAAGKPLATHVPATTLYHVFGAIAEADRVLGTGKRGDTIVPP
jgi:mannose-6-phosphate isomerase